MVRRSWYMRSRKVFESLGVLSRPRASKQPRSKLLVNRLEDRITPTLGIPSSYTEPPALLFTDNCDPLTDALKVSATPAGVSLTAPTGNVADLFSAGMVRYQDGVIRFSTTDLSSDGFGAPWAQTRSWSNVPLPETPAAF